MRMNWACALLLFVTFPFWFPIVAAVYIPIGVAWVVGYGIFLACRRLLRPAYDGGSK
jgi:hypothetical protein